MISSVYTNFIQNRFLFYFGISSLFLFVINKLVNYLYLAKSFFICLKLCYILQLHFLGLKTNYFSYCYNFMSTEQLLWSFYFCIYRLGINCMFFPCYYYSETNNLHLINLIMFYLLRVLFYLAASFNVYRMLLYLYMLSKSINVSGDYTLFNNGTCII